jgi:hypothetical protein
MYTKGSRSYFFDQKSIKACTHHQWAPKKKTEKQSCFCLKKSMRHARTSRRKKLDELLVQMWCLIKETKSNNKSRKETKSNTESRKEKKLMKRQAHTIPCKP